MHDSSIDLTDLKAHIDIMRFCKTKQAEYADMMERSRAAIEEALGDNEIGTLEGEPAVRWGHQKVNRLNQKALKAERPEIVAEYTEASTQRRFEIL